MAQCPPGSSRARLGFRQTFPLVIQVELMGVEPTTSCMPCKRSSQLSYSPLGTAHSSSLGRKDEVGCGPREVVQNRSRPRTTGVRNLSPMTLVRSPMQTLEARIEAAAQTDGTVTFMSGDTGVEVPWSQLHRE